MLQTIYVVSPLIKIFGSATGEAVGLMCAFQAFSSASPARQIVLSARQGGSFTRLVSPVYFHHLSFFLPFLV